MFGGKACPSQDSPALLFLQKIAQKALSFMWGMNRRAFFGGVGEAEMLTKKAVALGKPGHASGNGEEMAA